MNRYAQAQLNTLDNYFNHLYEYGYLSKENTLQTLFAVLLIDCLDQFEDYLTAEFEQDVNKILHNLECCVCTVNIENINDNCSCQ